MTERPIDYIFVTISLCITIPGTICILGFWLQIVPAPY